MTDAFMMLLAISEPRMLAWSFKESNLYACIPQVRMLGLNLSFYDHSSLMDLATDSASSLNLLRGTDLCLSPPIWSYLALGLVCKCYWEFLNVLGGPVSTSVSRALIEFLLYEAGRGSSSCGSCGFFFAIGVFDIGSKSSSRLGCTLRDLRFTGLRLPPQTHFLRQLLFMQRFSLFYTV